MPTAIVTGASAGLGAAIARGLAENGWNLILDARHPKPLHELADELRSRVRVTAIAGDVSEANHRRDLRAATDSLGELNALVNNASTLGPSPLPGLTDLSATDLARILAVNLQAPLALIAAVLPRLRAGAAVLNISSDAAVEAYPGWGGYGASKAALDHATGVLAAEHPELRCYALDPGDMRTAMHQAAFPGEDISDRPEPATVVPAVLELLAGTHPSGRYRAQDLLTVAHPVSPTVARVTA